MCERHTPIYLPSAQKIMKARLFKLIMFIEGASKDAMTFQPLDYEGAKAQLKEIAETYAQAISDEGQKVLQRCTFGGLSRNSTPIPSHYKEICPNALLLHVQNIRAKRNKQSKVFYQLVSA